MLAFNLVTLLKPLNAAGGIQHTALTREKRMAFAADFNAQLFPGRACGKLVTAGTDYFSLKILGVNFFFHLR